MAVDVQDILSINAVFPGIELLRTDAEIAQLGEALGSEIIPEVGLVLDAAQSTPAQGHRMQIPRDRMFVETGAQRTRVVREYPAHVDDVASVVRLVSHAHKITDLQGAIPSAFGFNIDLVYNQNSGEDARTYLGRRLFSRANDLNEQWSQVGGSGKLFALEGEWLWTITLEPRLQVANTSKVFLSVNLHIPAPRMPDGEEMERLLRTLWARAHDLIEKLDQRDNA